MLTGHVNKKDVHARMISFHGKICIKGTKSDIGIIFGIDLSNL